MQDSVFTKIIKGEIPCSKIYEDEKTLAFLDINPLLPGHTLVISKAQVDHVEDLGEADYTALFLTVKKVAQRIRQVLGAKRTPILVMGYDVPHAHVHVVPSDSSGQIYKALYESRPSVEPDFAALAKMAERLKF